MRQTTFGGLYAWEFEKDGREMRVRVEGQLTFNTSIAMIDAAIAGYGIALFPKTLSATCRRREAEASAGGLEPAFSGYHLYYPSRRQQSPAFKVIVDALRYKP